MVERTYIVHLTLEADVERVDDLPNVYEATDLVYSQMDGVLNEDTGLRCSNVAILYGSKVRS